MAEWRAVARVASSVDVTAETLVVSMADLTDAPKAGRSVAD